MTMAMKIDLKISQNENSVEMVVKYSPIFL